MSAYFRDLFLDMLPPGGFDTSPGSVAYALASGMAVPFANAEDRVLQAALEVLPHTSEEMQAEWERLVRAPARAGASVAERQALLVARWRYAIGLRLYAMRSILGPILQPEYYFRDTMDGAAPWFRYDQDLNNCTLTEVGGVSTLAVAGVTDARWTNAVTLPGIVTLPDHARLDKFWTAIQITGYTLGANDCAGGIVFYRNAENALTWGVHRSAGANRLRLWGIQRGSVWGPSDGVVIPATPFWLIAGREEDGIHRCYVEAALPSPFSVDGLTAVAQYSPAAKYISAGRFVKNDNVGATVLDVGEVRVAYGDQQNNVRIAETPLAQAALAGTGSKFFFSVTRYPDDAGSYSILEAQRAINKIKSGHTLGIAGESDGFRWADPNSLWSRDVWR